MMMPNDNHLLRYSMESNPVLNPLVHLYSDHRLLLQSAQLLVLLCSPTPMHH